QHRDQVEFWWLFLPYFPDFGEIAQHFLQDYVALLLRVDFRARARVHSGHVRPAGQGPPLLKREIKQRRQHLRRQLDRDTIDPVEYLAARQLLQDTDRPLANGGGHFRQIRRGDNRRDDFPLLVVPRRIHGDEAFLSELQRDIFKRDAPECGVGGVDLL